MKPKALWITEASKAQLLEAQQGDGVAVETLFSGISRGTEKLVFEGRVPESEHQRMRSPRQEGEFTFPVKYGYCNVGKVLEGDLAGKLVFALHPHQDNFRAHSEELTLIPEGVPAERAVLAANMETALNIVWDSGAQAGDKVAIVGAGVIGLLTGYLASRLPGSEVTLVDINPAKEVLARELGCSFATAESAPKDCDVVIHTSATNEGLSLALKLAGVGASVVEASWFGDAEVRLGLGGAFHSKRLKLVSSQVGSISPERSVRWSNQRRLGKALELLNDPILDALISGESSFMDLPANYAQILTDPNTLCHRVRY